MDAKTDEMVADEAAVDFDAQGADAMPADAFEHTLAKPITAHGEELRVLHWQEPTGLDIERAGNPVYLDFSGPSASITFNEKKMAAMISQLCQIPPSSVRMLTAKDWNAVAWKLFRFFTPPGA